MMVIASPAPLPPAGGCPVLFLAGSIDQGNAPDWQAEVIAALADCDVTVLNPRRAVWREAEASFRAQVAWELAGLERADIIVMVLTPGSLAPISLLELGLHARGGKLILCCPDGFWRKGNVDIVAELWYIPRVADLATLVQGLRCRLNPALTSAARSR